MNSKYCSFQKFDEQKKIGFADAINKIRVCFNASHRATELLQAALL